MKKLSLLLMIFFFSQMTQAQNNQGSYEILWKRVQKLESEALTKSALQVVDSISAKAKKEKNSAQTIKALLYSSKYAMTLEEESQLQIVNDFKAEIEKAEVPTRNVLQSYLANLYWQYFQQNRHRFYDRTKTESKIDSMDFRTWDLTTIFEEINLHFQASLENKNKLQEIGLDDFKEIIDQQPDSEVYRPTLFDILAHTALQFYKTDENSITRPSDKFEIDNPEILCEAYEFTQKPILTEDATLLQSKALIIYQELVQFHFPNPKLDALVDVDIDRLNYIHQNAIFSDKDEIFIEVLENSAEKVKQHEVSALYRYEIARLLHTQGNTYHPKTNDENRWKQKEALELCETVISQFPDSKGAEKCRALKSEIKAPSMQLTVESHIPVNSPSRVLIDFKNFEQLKLRAYEVEQDELKQLNNLYPETKQFAFIQRLPMVKEWQTRLKNENDYQHHSTELLLPPVENGQYILLAIPLDSNGKKVASGTFAFSALQVTDMALVETRTPTHYNYQVIDRQNGEPISEAELKFTYLKNYNKPYINKKLVSDKLGRVSIPLTDENWADISVVVSHDNQKAYFGEYNLNRKRDTDNKVTDPTCFLFTDRSIYRPGQPLYFKGIAIKNSQGESSVLENIVVVVDLYDVNGQIVGNREFKTNEYGSFSGEFMLPDSGLTGNFSLQARSSEIALNGYTHFSVEEYKRPKFETSFEPIMETYKINDSITIKGTAKAYAGSNLSNAKVSYRVKRVVYFPKWYYWSRPYNTISPQEIAHGETTTNTLGEYEIDFKAIPNDDVSKENFPTFQYEVTADVTDINGETHSATAFVTVGYHTLTATINVPNVLDKDKKNNTFTISTSNLNGQSLPAEGTVKMYKLKGPDYVLRPRPWPAPDYKNLTRPEFKKLFPHDAYEDEHDVLKWEKGELVWETTFDTGKSTKIEIESTEKWESGNYRIELETKDRFGQVVKALAQTTLISEDDRKLADNQLFHIKTDKESYSKGEKAEVTLLSSSKDLLVSVFVEKDKKIVDTRIIHLIENSKTVSIPVTEDDIGGFAINYTFSAYNSFHSGTLAISVPYPKTDLEIETMTFRDKLRPGTNETWAFRIKGPKGDKVSAELLASMYDASLDAFRNHEWGFNPLNRNGYYSNFYTNVNNSFGISSFRTYLNIDIYSYTPQKYDSFNWFGFYFGSGYFGDGRFRIMKKGEAAPMAMMAGGMDLEESADQNVALDSVPAAEEKRSEEQYDQKASFDAVQIRQNLQETAFFFPQLMTDIDGNISFSFTTPEALTQWKLQLLAHTKSLESEVVTLQTMTQKELMVLPNTPRFLREGDMVQFSAKVANLTDKGLSGQAKLELTDAITGDDISEQLLNSSQLGGNTSGSANQTGEASFMVDSLGNTKISWNLSIPENIQAIQYKIIARAGDFSDGEQNILPVLTNRMLVTETMPMWVRSNQTKTFVLDKLKTNTSSTLNHHQLTLEVTSNPAWYAVQALPYLMEYPYDCNEQVFARYYANTLASHIANSNPRIQEVFLQWESADVMVSNLEKNEELKSLLIQETPWLRDAQSETEQKKRIALLFNLDKMKHEQGNSLNKLKNSQKSSGAWAWFNGGPDNRIITQHIITGLGHLNKLISPERIAQNNTGSMVENGVDPEVRAIIEKAIAYLDEEFVAEYDRMKKYSKNFDDDHLSQTQIHYLYMRSFFKQFKTSGKVNEVTAYYRTQSQKYWTEKGLYAQGMLALLLHRMGDVTTSKKILRSLKENSITSEELGMYWKENTNSWHWYQAPIETQALMIEAFGEIDPEGHQDKTIDNLKVWLLKNKQTNSWKTTKATSEAIYALLLQGSDWLSITAAVEVVIGDLKIEPSQLKNIQVEAGTGYFKTSWNESDINPEKAEVQISKKGEGIAWGTLYWQYFEELDKITLADTPLQLKKKLFLKKNTDTGEEISEITENTRLKVGDLVRVRIELRSDREMEFVHMKDMRAAGFESINVISAYKWQDGLGYYESTKDTSTHFFFDYLPKGVYIFEYDLRVNNAGEFSNGITSIQSMYAPEFSSHSEGVRVSMDEIQ